MYITRMKLDAARSDTVKALYAPALLHSAVEAAFPGEHERVLWRADCVNGQHFLLLVSADAPNLTLAHERYGDARANPPWETRDYQPLLDRATPGSVWRFRLVANPVKSAPSGDWDNRERGKVQAHSSENYQRKWLLERAPRHGFALDEDAFTVLHSKWYVFSKGAQTQKVSLLAATYEGTLTVTDADLFRQTLTGGLGRGKAYGLGMLTIAGTGNG